MGREQDGRSRKMETHISDVFSELLTLDSNDSPARGNRLLDSAHRLKLIIRENPLRVLYPRYAHDSSWPTI